MRLLLADLEGVCAVWPTVPLSGGAGERSTARVMNEELDAADEASDQVRSPNWAAQAAAHPGWFIEDGVHLSPAGEAALQASLLTAARRCVAGLEA